MCYQSLNNFSTTTFMKRAGWNLDLKYWQNFHRDVAPRCRRGNNWFGWSDHAGVGTISTRLQRNGEATLDFGNCWDAGKVVVYLNDIAIASAEKNTPTKTVSFNFDHGDILKLRDEGANSVISLNGLTMKCSPDPGKSVI